MDRSYIPIKRFYQSCLPAAKANGYKYVVTLLARDRVVDGLYKMLEQQWHALDDITGKDFLFMFAGKYHEDDYHSEIVHHSRDSGSYGLRNEYIQILNRDPSLEMEVQYDFREREERGKFTPDLPKDHTRVISKLRHYFRISERDIPCLVFTNLHSRKHTVVPFKEIDLYEYFRNLYIELENIFNEMAQMSSYGAAEYYTMADKIIHQSKRYVSNSQNSSAQIQMHQYGSNSSQIGLVASGGVVNNYFYSNGMAEQKSQANGDVLDGFKVMVLEDDIFAARAYTSCLNDTGLFSADYSTTVDDMFFKATDTEYDIFVIDVSMERSKRYTEAETGGGWLTGLSVCTELRDKYPYALVVALSNNFAPQVLEFFDREDMCFFAKKDYSPEEFPRALTEYLAEIEFREEDWESKML